MNEKNYYDQYWWQKNLSNDGPFSTPPSWNEKELNYHYSFFKDFIGEKILDIGGGEGTFLNFLLMKRKDIREALVIDLSDQAINEGRKKGSLSSLQVKINC